MIVELSNRQLEIIECAGKILTASGVSGLTIKNLAKEMGFSESAIYRHFESKEGILVAMLTYLSDTMDERLETAIESINLPKEKFERLFQSQFEFFKAHPYFVVAVFSDGLMEISPSINNAILKLMNTKINHLTSIIMEGQKTGVFTSTISTEELTHVVMGSFRLEMYKWRISNFDFDLTRNGDRMVKTVLTLIEKT
jgi:TetR/AcrR family transcriptional regulator, fatty acid metabolism regulator protein